MIRMFCVIAAVFISSTMAVEAQEPPKATDSVPRSELEFIQYIPIRVGKVSCSVGVVYKVTRKGTKVEVASVATGKGADYRKWEVTDTKLNVGGEMVRPSTTEKIYTVQESIFRFPAAVVFAAIGSQYERYSDECSSGQVCPVTGQPIGGETRKQSSVERGIDKAGMAVGMGLLTAQAEGEITGQKCEFDLTNEQAEKLDNIKIVLENKSKNEKERVNVPLSDTPQKALAEFSAFVKKHPGLEHKAGVEKGGAFITVTDDENDTTVADFELPYMHTSDAPPISYIVQPDKPVDLTPEKPEE